MGWNWTVIYKAELWNDYAFCGNPFGGGFQRFVCAIEGEAVGDEGVEGELLLVGVEEFEGGAHVAWFTGPGAEDLKLLAGDDVGIPQDGTGIAIVAEDEVFSAVATHFHAFGDGGGVADAFEDNVGAVAAREVAHGGDAGFGGVHLVDVDNVIGAEAFGDFETRGGCAEQNDFGGAGTFSDSEGGESDGTCALDDDDVPPVDAGAFHAMDGGDERATCTDDGFGGEVGVDFENVRPGAKVMKLGVATEEMGMFIAGITNAVGAPMRAAGGLLFLGTIEAFAAGDGGGPGNTIAEGERLAVPVACETGAELFDAADGFVAENHGKIDLQLAFPKVDIGATDAGHLGADEGCARFNVRQRKFAQGERAFELFED